MPSGDQEGDRGRSAQQYVGPPVPDGERHASLGDPLAAVIGIGAAFDDPFVRGAVDAVSLLSSLLLAACGCLLASRRLAGAMAAAPGPTLILAVCGLSLVLFAIANHGSRRLGSPIPGMLARLGLVAIVASIALPLRSASPTTAVAAIVAVAASLLAVGGGSLLAVVRRIGHRSPAVPEPAVGLPAVDQAVMPSAAASPLEAGVVQRFERCALPSGAECIRGTVRVSIAAGSRLGVAHVGFCPPLAATPSVDVSTDYDEAEARVSAAEILPWGVRVECRLDEPAEESIDIPVDVRATAPAA